MTTTAHRTPLPDLLAVAMEELRTNPTISTYTFENGAEQRQYRYTYAAITARIRAATNAILNMIGTITGLGDSFTDFLDAIHEATA